jgi:peptidyl-Lys metalloendopeptidase
VPDHAGNSPLTGPDSQASTLAHELSHFDSVDGTNDHEYGIPKSKGLAKKDPAKAIDNADNFLYYVENAP